MGEAVAWERYGALAALVVFIVTSVWLGGLAQRVVEKGNFLKGYFLGNRGLGVWALALTATVQSGGTFMGFPSYVYQYGWVGALFIASYMMVPLAGFGIIGKRVAQISRKTGAITMPDLLRNRFDSPLLGLISSLVIMTFLSCMMIAQFKAGAIIMKLALTGAPIAETGSTTYDTAFYIGLVVFALTVVGYTLIGGFLAAVWTDLFQSVMMLFGVVILLYLSLQAAGGMENATRLAIANRGPDYLAAPGYDPLPHTNRVPASSPASIVEVPNAEAQGDDSDRTGWLPLAGAMSFFMLWPFAGLASPASVVRVMAVKNTGTLRQSIPVLCLYNMFIYLPIIIIAICAQALLPGLSAPDEAIPRMTFHVTRELTGGSLIAGLVLAAPFGAIMATVSSYLVVIASGVVRDVYQRFVRPQATESEIRGLAYVAMVAVGAVAIVANLQPIDHLQKMVVYSTTNTGCAFLVPLAMLCYWRRANAAGVMAAMCSGVATVSMLYGLGIAMHGWTAFTPTKPLEFDPLIWGNLVALLVGIVWTLFTPAPHEALAARFFDAEPAPASAAPSDLVLVK
jgi:sodium/pantothenate symporter